MTRRLTAALAPVLLVCGTASGDTLERVAIAPAAGVEVFTRNVARDQLDRDLFGDPYSSVVLARIDVYEAFPYLESRTFQIVSDPGWNRLLVGETGGGLTAFDGSGTPFGKLSEPRGLALAPDGRILLADSGNHRVLILRAVTEFDAVTLEPVGSVEGLARPYDVAVSDAGTPEDASDDRLYVADAGRNRVVSYALDATSARLMASVGELGSGTGRFAGPIAVAAGRRDGVSTGEVLVADAHNRRIVRLRDEGASLRWLGSTPDDFDVITSLDTDSWGNVFAAGPNRGVVKLSPTLEPVATIASGATRPRDFHVVYADVHDHAHGNTIRRGEGKGVLVEGWTPRSGIDLWRLGVDVRNLTVRNDDGVRADFLLTDRAQVTAEILDPVSGKVMARTDGGVRDAGSGWLAFAGDDFLSNLEPGSYVMRVDAASVYEDGPTARREAAFSTAGTAFDTPQRPLLLGNVPNPFQGATEIRFVVPDGGPTPASIRIFDAQGRYLRTVLDETVAPGLASVSWDGRDAAGRALGAGIYFYQVTIGRTRLVSKMILIR